MVEDTQRVDLDLQGEGELSRLLQAGASRRSLFKATAGIAGLAGSLAFGQTLAQDDATPDAATPDAGSTQQPNILVIFGDDIGYWNTSAYNLGMMGYQAPNIDQIAREGVQFTESGRIRRT